ncbi:MAG: M28 family peptidase [Aeoliella sp.]
MNPNLRCRVACFTLGASALLFAGCHQPSTAPALAAPLAEPAEMRVVAAEPVVKQTSAQLDQRNPLDAERAFGYLTQLVKLGPRPSGTVGMARQQVVVTSQFEELGGKVSRQEFVIRHPLTGKQTPCANLIVEWHPERVDRVLVCAHYDTRPLPDQDPNPHRRRDGMFVGANDGASGVAVLMELAHHLPHLDPRVGVDFVLFDAEELVYGNNVYRRQQGEYFLGSKHFARDYRKNRPGYRYHWGVLLDMVGDAQLEILQEKYSLSWPDTRPLVADLWTIAHRLGVKEFVPRTKRGRDEGYIRDDHLALRNIARIPTCNIIDAEYPDASFGEPGSYWHTEQDLPRHCSGDSLAKVGWVVLEWLRTADVRQ